MYPYDPLKEFNPDGAEQPIFHCAERFESRFFMQHLMDLEYSQGKEAALALYRTEKMVAARYYREKLNWLVQNDADHEIIDWIKGIISQWDNGLMSVSNLANLYMKESMRSLILDLYMP